MTTRLCTFLGLPVLLLACLPLPVLGADPALTLIDNGQPRAAIVLGDNLRTADAAVGALVSNLKQMSGATLPVLSSKDLADATVEAGKLHSSRADAFILLGESDLAKKLGIDTTGLGNGGIRLKTTGNVVAIMGHREGSAGKRDTVNGNAVFRFLESLGCRCLWPGESGKVVPHRSTITVPALDVRFTPPIGQRNIRFAPLNARGAEQGLAWLGATAADQRTAFEAAQRTEAEGTWSAWNSLGGNLGIVGGAAGCGLRGGWDKYGKEHPEWFALQPDGTRDQSKAKERWRLCVSNPGLVDQVAQDILARLDGHAQAAISLCPNDGGYSNFCQCAACKALDASDGPKIKMLIFAKVGSGERTEAEYVSLTDRYVHYWNAVAERVTKVVPDQLFLVEAYSYYSDPPVHERLHPNLVVRYVPSVADGWKGWQAAGAKRAYWRPNNMGSGYRYGVLSPKARETAATLGYLGQNGVLATDMDSIYNNWATQGLLYYTAARLSWDPTQNYDALLDDYCHSGFGAGADAVKAYFQLIEKNVQPRIDAGRNGFPLITSANLDTMRAQLVAAGEATKNDPASHRRVAFLRTGFEFTAISAEADSLRKADDSKPDAAKVNPVMERRWQMMRAMLRSEPLAVNVAVVAGYDAPLNTALAWKGPGDAAKNGTLQLKPGDDWLNADQSATRKGGAQQ